MQRDIVLLPTYFRPEYLQLCLEHLVKAEGITSKEIWILQDHHLNDEYIHAVEENWTQEVLASWKPYTALDIKFIRLPFHITPGNSRNVLEGYRRAYHTDAQFVYLVEDDVFVQPDFFQWHEAVQADGDYYCSIAHGCYHRNKEVRTDIADSGAYFTSHRDYASLG